MRTLLSLFALCLAPALSLADWPQWRGPHRDGTAVGVKVPAEWPAKLTPGWTVEVGEGHSSPVVVGDRVYIFARQDDKEVTRCLKLDSGKEVWSDSYPAPYTMNPAARRHGKGPKSTPTVADGRVFTFGIDGILSALDARTGKVLWRKTFEKKYPKTSPLYGTALSPLVVDGMCIVHVGGHDKGALTAFDVRTGAEKWSNPLDGPAYTSPVLAEWDGKSYLVTQTQNNLLVADPATGKTVWKQEFKTAYDQNIVTPLVYKDLVIFSGIGTDVRALRPVKKGEGLDFEEVWRNRDHPMYMSSPVRKGDLLFGMSRRSNGHVFCLDAGTGKTLWQSKGRMGNNMALIVAGDFLLLQTNTSKLIVARANGKGYEPVAQYKVADTPTWAHPAFLGDRILVKDEKTLRLWKVGE